MCSAPNVYMFVYILIGTHMVPLIPGVNILQLYFHPEVVILYNAFTWGGHIIIKYHHPGMKI